MDRENKHSALAAWNTRADLHTAAMGRAYVAGMEAGAEKAFNSDPYAREPDKPFDDWGDMRADTPERHAAHVLDHAMWTLANEIRALAADPAHVKAAVAKLTEGEG
jgi:DNA-binding IclR family transcriptional regulator